MAIARIEQRSATVWSKPSAMTAGAGALLGLVSLFFLWGAVQRFMVRTNYTEAAFKLDSNRRLEVKTYAEKAQSWGRHAESKELLAKALVEANQLDAAEKQYTEIAAGARRAMGSTGLGIVLLRKADLEKDPKKAVEIAKKAKDRFVEAKAADTGLVEAQIGAATADLIAGVRMNDAAKIQAARGEFTKIHKSLQASEDLASKVTREGYMDLYLGLARANASAAKYSTFALEYAGSARRYLPTSNTLFAMELSLQAQQMAEAPPTAPEIRASKTYEKLKTLRERVVSSPKAMEEVVDSWFALTLAAAAALARGGDIPASKELLGLALQSPRTQDGLLAPVLEVSLALETARKAETDWRKRQTNYSQAYGLIVKVNAMKELEDPSRAHLRATLLNNQAFLEEDTAAQGGGESRYEQAVKLLTKALEAEQAAGLPDGSYEVRRNLAVIQKRRGKPEAADHFAAAQRAAAGRSDEGVRRDLENLQKYFAGSSQ